MQFKFTTSFSFIVVIITRSFYYIHFRPVDHVHRADQEPDLQLLEARVRPLRAGNPEAFRIRRQVLHGPLSPQNGHGWTVGRLRT